MKLQAPLLQGSILDDQIALETTAVEEGVARYRELAREATARGDGANLKPAERLQLHWYKPLVAAIRQEQAACWAGKSDTGRQHYGIYITQIGAPQLAVITMHQMVGQCLSEDSVPVVRLAYAIGRDALAEANLRKAKEDAAEELRALNRAVRRVTPTLVNRLARKNDLADEGWRRKVSIAMGVRLIWLMVGSASVDHYDQQFHLAFHHRRVRTAGRTVAIISMDPRAHTMIDDGHAARALLRPRYLPMVVAPYRWTEDAQGGYVKIRTPYISKPTPTQKAALAKADLSGVNAALDAVGAQAWRINPKIYHTMVRLWGSGGGLLGVPHAEDFPIPPEVVSEDEEIIQANKRLRAETYTRNVALRSSRREWTLKLDVATRLLDRQEIFFPHQFDFRGRCYPIPVHLNHQGDDVCRGLLEFAHGKPTADKRWLMIHAANCYGMDKGTFAERQKWTMANLAGVTASAARPLEVDFWQRAENPWQFLAACIALMDTEHGMRIPIQLDGTCNGLQHYSAMGLDPEGAAVVNLLPAERPQDVYSKVADNVARLVAYDAQAGVAEAGWIADIVSRKTVKQVVMTSVYGVTMVGARAQVYAALSDAGLDDDRRYKASAYLSRKVLDGIGTVCPAARRIMDWLTECAGIVARKPINQPVRWTTPLGLPVVQPYRNHRTVSVRTIMQTITMLVPDDTVPVKVGKQIDAFSPNFVHSLDGTHMLMTALACRRAGVDFAAVHDSFWTHAATVDQMGKIIREQFIDLYRRPILEDLVAEFRSRHPEGEFRDPPPKGTLDLEVVRNAPYLFS